MTEDDNHKHSGPSMEISGPMGTSMRARGYDAVTLLLTIGVIINGVVSWQNTHELKLMTDAMQRAAVSNLELAKTQRMLTCYVAIDDPKVRMEYIMDPSSVCYRVMQ